jgi:hypothetical protein
MAAALLNTTDSAPLPEVLHMLAELFSDLGPDRVAGMSVHYGNVRIQPSELTDGEAIARSLGLDSAWDNHAVIPAFTDWSGDVNGVEVHVHGALRGRAS